MGFFSGIANFTASIIDTACSICGKIGGAVSTIAGRFLNPIPKLFPTLQIIATLVTVVVKVAEILINKPEPELPEELAVKAEDAELTSEDFDSFDAYMEYLRNDIKADQSKLNAMEPEERLQYALAGIGMYVYQMEERYGLKLEPYFWYSAIRMDLDAEDTANLVKGMKENKVLDGGALSDYMNGTLDPVSCSAIYHSLDHMLEQRGISAAGDRATAIVGMRSDYLEKDGLPV